MKRITVREIAAGAVAANANRPATRIVHDSPDARLVVFRISSGQVVAPHRNGSTVSIAVISGRGYIRGGDDEQAVTAGEVIVFEPDELHGMRADAEELVLLATITPRPGSRRADASEGISAARATAGE